MLENETAQAVELQLLRRAQELRDQEYLQGAAQTYAQVAKMFAAKSIFQDAATCFSTAADLYICSDMPSQAEHAFHDAEYSSINADQYLQAFSREWNRLEFAQRQPDWASLGNAYEQIGELFDQGQSEKPVNKTVLEGIKRWSSYIS